MQVSGGAADGPFAVRIRAVAKVDHLRLTLRFRSGKLARWGLCVCCSGDFLGSRTLRWSTRWSMGWLRSRPCSGPLRRALLQFLYRRWRLQRPPVFSGPWSQRRLRPWSQRRFLRNHFASALSRVSRIPGGFFPRAAFLPHADGAVSRGGMRGLRLVRAACGALAFPNFVPRPTDGFTVTVSRSIDLCRRERERERVRVRRCAFAGSFPRAQQPRGAVVSRGQLAVHLLEQSDCLLDFPRNARRLQRFARDGVGVVAEGHSHGGRHMGSVVRPQQRPRVGVDQMIVIRLRSALLMLGSTEQVARTRLRVLHVEEEGLRRDAPPEAQHPQRPKPLDLVEAVAHEPFVEVRDHGRVSHYQIRLVALGFYALEHANVVCLRLKHLLVVCARVAEREVLVVHLAPLVVIAVADLLECQWRRRCRLRLQASLELRCPHVLIASGLICMLKRGDHEGVVAAREDLRICSGHFVKLLRQAVHRPMIHVTVQEVRRPHEIQGCVAELVDREHRRPASVIPEDVHAHSVGAALLRDLGGIKEMFVARRNIDGHGDGRTPALANGV
mmetsp:Transcript_18211/g.69031  ORF Transcript_18211/g.69031 Transcript_18211/m.69031 type:complete len:556 (-) Transcript_18211:1852-3519(-)